MNINTCLVGSYSSGKTTLIQNYMFHNVELPKPDPTIGMSGLEKHFVFDKTQIKNLIFDTAGQERYASLIPVYLRNCDILIFTIDSSDYSNSFNYFKTVIPDVVNLNKYIIICFTKIDKSNIYESETIKEIDDIMSSYKKTYKIIYTSSVDKKNIAKPFEYYLHKVVNDNQIRDMDEIIIKESLEDNVTKSCCILS